MNSLARVQQLGTFTPCSVLQCPCFLCKLKFRQELPTSSQFRYCSTALMGPWTPPDAQPSASFLAQKGQSLLQHTSAALSSFTSRYPTTSLPRMSKYDHAPVLIMPGDVPCMTRVFRQRLIEMYFYSACTCKLEGFKAAWLYKSSCGT